MTEFSTDYFNNIIKRYAEPPFHCVSLVVAHPVTGLTYPIVQVPGGALVPVRCKSDSPDGGKSARVDTYYIRRLGPESNAPQSGAEWDAFLERCLLNRKEELVGKMASLLGVGRLGLALGPTAAPAHPFAELRAFRDESLTRLEQLQRDKLPDNDPARFEHGRYVLSARIVGELKSVSPNELLDALRGLRKYTGWPPLYVFTRPELEPYPVGDSIIECWLARDEARDAAHADFWRVSAEGMVTLVRGHQEDSPEIAEKGGGPPVGHGLEVTLPAWRVAEFVLRVRELGGRLAAGPFQLQFIVQWEGLEGRKLFSFGGKRAIFEDYVAHEPKYVIEKEVSPDDIDAALPSVTESLVTPLLRRFSFFEPPSPFYKEELDKMLRREFT